MVALAPAPVAPPLAALLRCCCCCCCRCCCRCCVRWVGDPAASPAAGVAAGGGLLPPDLAFWSAVASFHCTQPAARAIPQSRLRKQCEFRFLVSFWHAKFHQPHPLHRKQSGSLLGAGRSFLDFCWKAMAEEPWWPSSTAAAETSWSVVETRPTRPSLLRARTRVRR